jgi:hypothetical protein
MLPIERVEERVRRDALDGWRLCPGSACDQQAGNQRRASQHSVVLSARG